MELLVLPLVMLAMWALIIRPQQQRQKQQLILVQGAGIGDEIVTAGGFVGTIMDVHDPDNDDNGLRADEILLALASDVEVVLRRRSIAEIRERWDGQFADGTYLDDEHDDDAATDDDSSESPDQHQGPIID